MAASIALLRPLRRGVSDRDECQSAQRRREQTQARCEQLLNGSGALGCSAAHDGLRERCASGGRDCVALGPSAHRRGAANCARRRTLAARSTQQAGRPVPVPLPLQRAGRWPLARWGGVCSA
jgi:hypothetical protein